MGCDSCENIVIITEEDNKRAHNLAVTDLLRNHAQEYRTLYSQHAKELAAAKTQHLEPTIQERLDRLKEKP